MSKPFKDLTEDMPQERKDHIEALKLEATANTTVVEDRIRMYHSPSCPSPCLTLHPCQYNSGDTGLCGQRMFWVPALGKFECPDELWGLGKHEPLSRTRGRRNDPRRTKKPPSKSGRGI